MDGGPCICANHPPSICLNFTSSIRGFNSLIDIILLFFLDDNRLNASCSKSGANIHSKKCSDIISAVALVTVCVNPITQPKALSGSLNKAFFHDFTWWASTATPEGFECFTITHPCLSSLQNIIRERRILRVPSKSK